MLNRFKFLFVFFIIFAVKFIHSDSLSVYPSLYYTYGSYDSERNSQSIATYNSFTLNHKSFFILAFDNLTISDPDWNYKQQSLTSGFIFYLFPFTLKANYMHIKGNFDYLPFPFPYSDYTNLYNADATLYINPLYAGVSYTFNNKIGFKHQQVHQVTGRIEYIPHYSFFLSLKPSYSNLNDGRELFSVALRLQYLFHSNFVAKAGGFAGERAYYFDSDLLTIYNQDETQKYQFFAQIDYIPLPAIAIIFSYIHTGFDNYSINYFVTGIRSYFTL